MTPSVTALPLILTGKNHAAGPKSPSPLNCTCSLPRPEHLRHDHRTQRRLDITGCEPRPQLTVQQDVPERPPHDHRLVQRQVPLGNLPGPCTDGASKPAGAVAAELVLDVLQVLEALVELVLHAEEPCVRGDHAIAVLGGRIVGPVVGVLLVGELALGVQAQRVDAVFAVPTSRIRGRREAPVAVCGVVESVLALGARREDDSHPRPRVPNRLRGRTGPA